MDMSAKRVNLIRSAIMSLSTGIAFGTWMIYQVELVGMNPTQLVLLGTVMEVTIFLCEVPTGIVADVYSRRLSIIIGFVLMGVGYIVTGAVPVFAVLVVGQILWGLGFTFTSGATDAWIVDELGQQEAERAFIQMSQLGNMMGLLALLISTGLALISLQLPLIVGGVLLIGGAGYLLLNMPENGFKPTPREDRSTWGKYWATFRDGLAVVRGRPMLWRILGVGFFLGLFSEGWDRLWQAHLIQNVGLPAGLPSVIAIGIIGIADALVGIYVLDRIQRRLENDPRRNLTAIMMVLVGLMVVSMIAFALAPHLAVALLAFYLFSSARGVIGPLFGGWTNRHIDSNVRATVLSMSSQTDAIGQIAGAIPVAGIGGFSSRWAIALSALLLAPAVPLLNSVHGQEQPAPVASPTAE
jgi:MFS transporter, DHA3 family, tetracycline resistance protein